MKITPGSAIVASLLLLGSSDHEVAARQGQPEEPAELEPPSPRKVSKTRGMTGDSARHQQNRELRGRSRSSPYPRNNNYSYYDNREEEGEEGGVEAGPPTYVRRVLVPRQEQILPYRSTFPWFDMMCIWLNYIVVMLLYMFKLFVGRNNVYKQREQNEIFDK